jgi:sporulation protein YlmC with PRC-barrel domain
MHYVQRVQAFHEFGMPAQIKGDHMAQPQLMHQPKVMSASTLTGDTVVNMQNEKLGKIEHIMLDLATGRVAYAVLSFGGFLGMGDKLFAIPWSSLRVDTENKQLVLNIDKKLLDSAPGFNNEQWPDMADRTWATGINNYYGAKPYWE